MENRSYVLDRLKSKTMSIDEFNFDALQAPPISAMFTPMDIMQLNQIAKSIRYAAKPQVKYQEIDKIMRKRGFEKFIAGTNRIVYRPVEDSTFLVKVATDAVGICDGPREIQNQMIFKPFVQKLFEITPCGTLGVFERVVPITSREEFLSVASDIYEVINNWFVGEYILEDFGTKFFMNWGIRKGFGPVLLDFPYVYKLDGDKLFCNAPNPNNPSGCCEGVIDYDPGFNFLYCTKCGVKYKARELALAIKENNVLVKSEGEIKMKVSVKGGSKNISKEIVTGEYAGMAKAMPTAPIRGKAEEVIKEETSHVAAHVNLSSDSKKVFEEPKIEEIKAPKATGVKKEVVCPIEFDESLKKKDVVEGFEKAGEARKKAILNKESDTEKFNQHMEKALEILKNTENKEEKMAMEEAITQAFADKISEAVNKIKEKCDSAKDEEEPKTLNRLLSALNKAGEIMEALGETEILKMDQNEVQGFVNSIPASLVDMMIKELFASKKYHTSFNCDSISYESDEDTNYIVFSIVPKIVRGDEDQEEDTSVEIYEDDNSFNLGVYPKDLVEPMADSGYTVVEKSENDATIYNDCKYFAGKIVNIKDIFQNKQQSKILVVVDENGNYLTVDDGNIIAIDLIDDRSVDSLSVVSSQWLETTLHELEEAKRTEDEPQQENETLEQALDGIPTGVLPPVSVNGVPVNEEE